jgi:pimeloyl-ACP methyl ester carboxylesterase
MTELPLVGARAGNTGKDEPAGLEHLTVGRGDVSLHVVRSRPWRAHDRDHGRTPIVFLHGFPDTSETWSLQLEALGRTHPVAAFDQRGVGGSTAPTLRDGYAYERHLEDIDAVLDALVGPEGQVHFVGHDWGGALAWMFTERPDRARRLRSLTVIAGPHPGLMPRRILRAIKNRELGLAFDQLRKLWYMAMFQLPQLPEWLIRAQFPGIWLRAMRSGGVPQSDPMLRDFDREGTRKAMLAPLALYRQIPQGLVRPREVHPVSMPVCAIVPLRDLALRTEMYEDLDEVAADLEVHHLDTNHWAQRERPAEVAAIVDAFVRRVDGER